MVFANTYIKKKLKYFMKEICKTMINLRIFSTDTLQ